MSTLTKATITEFSKLKPGDKLSETQYYSVVKKSGNKVQLVNDQGENIVVSEDYVENLLVSADQFTETKKINKTEAATLFLENKGVVMTVNYNKQVNKANVLKDVMTAYEGSTLKSMEKAISKALDKALEGEERTMIGRHYGSMNELGRVNFIDMEVEKDTSKDYDTRTRQVDPRTINYLIVRGVKYVVK